MNPATRRLTIQDAVLRNFKGAREFSVEPQGADFEIYGDNATGKTTFADAYYWLLFDKDSLNRKDFEIKTIDPVSGETLHRLCHEAEFTFQNGGDDVTLRKVYAENWTKKRGAAEGTFSGHSTEHFVNGVPVQKKDFDSQVAAICSEKRFRLLSDPTFFNVHLPWQERRTLLLEVCGDVTDAQVIASSPALADLPSILANRSADDHKKVVTEQRKKINEELEKVPVRIDEASRSLGSILQLQAQSPLSAQTVKEAQERVTALQREKTSLQAGGGIAEATKRLREKEAQIQHRENELSKESSQEFEESQRLVRAKSDQLNLAQRKRDETENEVRAHDRNAEKLESECALLREEYKRENEKLIAFTQATVCPACEQPIPEERLAAARAKAEEEFNLAKSKRLENIRANGKSRAKESEQAKEAAARLKENLEANQADVKRIGEEIEELKASIPAPTAESTAPDATVEALKSERTAILQEIAQLTNDAQGKVDALQSLVDDAQRDLDAAHRAEARDQEAERTKKRIAELEIDQKKLANEHERLTRELFLIEEFVRAKVKLLTERINERFRVARFRLFEEQVNGGIAECCEVTVDGVPYGSLNHGTRLNVGLDVIDTLAEHFGFAPPVVIDNAESVTSILPTIGQQVRLVVSANDKRLRTVVAQSKETYKEKVTA